MIHFLQPEWLWLLALLPLVLLWRGGGFLRDSDGHLLASLMVGTRRRVAAARSPKANRQPLSRFGVPTSAALLSLCWLLPVHSAPASPSSAAAAYKRGDFPAAERDYSTAAASDPKQPILQFDAGAAAYKAGEFPQAARAFQASVNASPSGGVQRLVDQEDAYYNLGNTLYREGQKTEQKDPQATIQNWTQALKAYDAALQLRADDADSKFNRELVSRKLEALKKAQSQQSKPPQNQPKQPSQSKPQQGQGQQAKDNSSPSKPQQQAGQPKQQPGGQPQGGKAQPGQPNGQPQQANGQPRQAKQNPGGTPSSKDQTNPDPPREQKNESSAAANGSMPRADRAQGNADSQPGQMVQAADDHRLPGEMSREEARELLDSVKDEERRPPAAPVARNGAIDTSSDEPPEFYPSSIGKSRQHQRSTPWAISMLDD